MRYLFGDYTLDTRSYELRRAGTLVPLRPKVFQVLAYLLAHSDRVISKQELMAQGWPGQSISDETLSTCVTAARQAVGDHGQRQDVIQTRRGLGYRFVAPVAMRHDDPGPAMETPQTSSMSQTASLHPGNALPATTLPPEPMAAVASALAPLRPAAPPTTRLSVAGEAKPVTVLAGRLHRGVTARLDPEVLHASMQTVWTVVRAEVQGYGGTLQRLLDDGFVVLFGAPVAQEDHARRAVLAALGVQQRLQDHVAAPGWPAGTPLAVGLGLHTGRVLVGPLGDEGQWPYTAVGDTTRLARRLARQAPPGAMLISAATQRLVQHMVRVQAYTPAAGHSPARLAYTVLALISSPAPLLAGTTGPLSPFVGRQHELAVLHARVTQAATGQGQVVGIVGEPGMGKSRLVYEWRQGSPIERFAHLAARCVSYGSATPYRPVGDLLRHLWAITDTDDPATIRAKVIGGLQDVGIEVEEAAPSLWPVLGLPDTTVGLDGLSPQSRRTRTFATLHRLYRHLSQQRPVLLEVEDVHWIDPTSQEYLEALVDQVAGLPILLLVTFRPGYRPPWMDKSYATQLTLPPLSPTDGADPRHGAGGAGGAPRPSPARRQVSAPGGGGHRYGSTLGPVTGGGYRAGGRPAGPAHPLAPGGIPPRNALRTRPYLYLQTCPDPRGDI